MQIFFHKTVGNIALSDGVNTELFYQNMKKKLLDFMILLVNLLQKIRLINHKSYYEKFNKSLQLSFDVFVCFIIGQ